MKKYVLDENVEKFIVGEPKQMDYSPSQVEVLIIPFLKHLSRTFTEIPIERQDERFTSKMAFQSMIEGGIKKQRKNKALVDEISATLILQAYLNRK